MPTKPTARARRTELAQEHERDTNPPVIEIEGQVEPGLRKACALALAAAGATEGHVSIEFVDADRMRELNLGFLGHDYPTDVLSFPIDGLGPCQGPRELGDIVICPQYTTDLAAAVCHGALHLCGYDHETDSGQMRELERQVLARLACERFADDSPH